MRWAYVAAALAGFIVGAMLFEQAAWGWHFAREEVPGWSAWHWLRSSIVAGLSIALVILLTDAATAFSPVVTWRAQALAWFSLVTAATLTLVLIISPARYHALGAEDGAIEWVSAVLLFAAALMLAAGAWRARGAFQRSAAAALALLFFVMAMEEISWFQRVIGFATPEAVAARNWQGEFNLHNLQTDVTELALYSGTGLFLMLLPLARETIGDRAWLARVIGLFPSRGAAAAAAPMLAFTYGHWNLLPVQAAFWIGLAACAVFACRSRGGQRVLWMCMAALVATSQVVHLALGQMMTAVYDASEFRELFIALGLAAYGWQQWREPTKGYSDQSTRS